MIKKHKTHELNHKKNNHRIDDIIIYVGTVIIGIAIVLHVLS